MKGVQYYELFGGIAHKNCALLFSDVAITNIMNAQEIFLKRK